MRLEQQQRDFIKLLLRSPDIGDGWRSVSEPLVPVVSKEAAKSPELFDWQPDAKPARIRLTERGVVVGEYL